VARAIRDPLWPFLLRLDPAACSSDGNTRFRGKRRENPTHVMDGRRTCHVTPPSPHGASPDLIRRPGDRRTPRFKNRFATRPSCGSRIKSGKASGIDGSAQWPVV